MGGDPAHWNNQKTAHAPLGLKAGDLARSTMRRHTAQREACLVVNKLENLNQGP